MACPLCLIAEIQIKPFTLFAFHGLKEFHVGFGIF